jgi:hypothetical protein
MPKQSNSTTVLLERELIIYRRENSDLWQCRYKVGGRWIRTTTKERDLVKAKRKAKELLIEAEIRKRENLPVITRRFVSVAKLAVERMEKEIASGKGKATYKDYISVIEEYLIPIFSRRNITNIDYEALNELDLKRIEIMGKEPTHSTMLTHNAALNRVFDEAIMRNYITEASRPKLEAKGKVGNRRAAFEVEEVRALLANFDDWIERARADSKELRMLMRDYVEMLLDTGARPGKELWTSPILVDI